jgi:protein-tyrosine-phosphatase
LYAHEGDPITPAAVDALQGEGVVSRPDNDYLSHRARPVSEDLVAEADAIVGLTASHAMQLMLRFPEAASKISTLPMDISDPFGGSAEVYRDCLAQLRRAIELSFFTGAQE